MNATTITRTELTELAEAGAITLAHTHTKTGKPVTHELRTSASVVATQFIPAAVTYVRAPMRGTSSAKFGTAPLATSTFTLADGRLVRAD